MTESEKVNRAFDKLETLRGKVCSCGSGLERRALIDARRIFCTYVCDACERERRKEFRPDIFTDSNYPTYEDVVDVD